MLKNAISSGEFYIINDIKYSRVGGKYVMGSPYAITDDGIKLYSVKGDKTHTYIVDSLSSDLFASNVPVIVNELPTGVFLRNQYIENKELLDFCNLLFAWKNEHDISAVNPDCTNIALAVHTSSFLRIDLCFKNFKASQVFLGFICEIDKRFYFIDSETARTSSYNGQEREFPCIEVREDYYKLLDRYFR